MHQGLSTRSVRSHTKVFYSLLCELTHDNEILAIPDLSCDSLIVSHRATRIDPALRLSKLTAFINPVKDQWKNESLKAALGSYNGFCELLGLDKVQKYLVERRVHGNADWGSTDLDAEGLALQAELEQRQSVCPTV